MKILITGGHFSPAYAVLTELSKRVHEVAIAGRKHPFEGDATESYEYLISKKKNIPFFEVKATRFRRKFSSYTIMSLARSPLGFLGGFKILSAYKPDMVVTFGGYIGLPICYASWILGIPVVLHEQTQRAGLASLLISKIAKKICISFITSKKYFPERKTILTGNPIREEVLRLDKAIQVPAGKVVYVTGGSTGSHKINLIIGQIIGNLISNYVIIHQTGENKFGDYEKLSVIRKGLPRPLQEKYVLSKFIDPRFLASIFKKADLVVSRAGINTACEILATGKIALLIPLPHGQHNEQLENAKLIKKIGTGEYIEEDEASAEHVLQKIDAMLANYKQYEQNLPKVKKYFHENAAKKIADTIENVYDKKTS